MLSESEQNEALAELPGNLGFTILLEILEEQLHQTLKEMAAARSDDQVLRLARLWQTQYNYLTVMGTTPQSIKEHLAEEFNQRQESMAGVDDILFPPQRRQKLRELEELIETPGRKRK